MGRPQTQSRAPTIDQLPPVRPPSSTSSSDSYRTGSDGSTDLSPTPDMRSAENHQRINHNNSTTYTDAVHTRFRPLSDADTFACHTCRTTFKANSLVAVMEHYVQHTAPPDEVFHSACLYCSGKVHQYRLAPSDSGRRSLDDKDNPARYYHDCRRWTSGLDR